MTHAQPVKVTAQQIWDAMPPEVVDTICVNIGAALACAGQPMMERAQMSRQCAEFIQDARRHGDGGHLTAPQKVMLHRVVWRWCLDITAGPQAQRVDADEDAASDHGGIGP